MDKYEKIIGANAIYVYVLSTSNLVFINDYYIKIFNKFEYPIFEAIKKLGVPDKSFEGLNSKYEGTKLQDNSLTIFNNSGIGINSTSDLIKNEDKLGYLLDFILEQLNEL